jgi:hypothetical protein
MSPPHSSVPNISKMDKGETIADAPEIPVIEVPEKWSNINCIRQCLWVNQGVLDTPSNVEDKEDVKIIESDWRKCFHLYPLQTRAGKKG